MPRVSRPGGNPALLGQQVVSVAPGFWIQKSTIQDQPRRCFKSTLKAPTAARSIAEWIRGSLPESDVAASINPRPDPLAFVMNARCPYLPAVAGNVDLPTISRSSARKYTLADARSLPVRRVVRSSILRIRCPLLWCSRTGLACCHDQLDESRISNNLL